MKIQALPRNIILIGFMGTGKTTIGRRLADSLGFEFVDTDELIKTLAGKSIPSIFKEDGETVFRDWETKALKSATSQKARVISTGGGAPTMDRNQELILHGGFAVWLKASVNRIYERVSSNNDRPLLRVDNPKQTIARMLEDRLDSYRETSHFSVSTDDLSPEELAYGIGESAKVFFQEHG